MRTMRKYLPIIVLLLLLVSAPALAQEVTPEPDTVIVTTDYNLLPELFGFFGVIAVAMLTGAGGIAVILVVAIRAIFSSPAIVQAAERKYETLPEDVREAGREITRLLQEITDGVPAHTKIGTAGDFDPKPNG